MNTYPQTEAAVLVNTDQPLQFFKNIEIPALRPGQVLCKILFAGLCHSQLMEARGRRGEDKYLPHMLGHEGVATVVDVGPDVSKISPGDKVVMGWIKGEGLDAGGSVYQHESGPINAGAVTTFSTYSVVSENRLVKVPDKVDDKTAVLFGCALPTGAGIVLNQLKPQAGSTVLVFGLGGIGLSAMLALHHFKPAQVIAIDIEPHKLEMAKELGATQVFLADETGIEAFHQAFPNGVDYAVESAGRTDTIEQAFNMVKRGGGKCIFASHPTAGETIKIDPFELICGKQIQGSWGGASKPDKDIPLIADIINRYALPVHNLLSNEYQLTQINQALDDLEQRKIVRALIKVE